MIKASDVPPALFRNCQIWRNLASLALFIQQGLRGCGDGQEVALAICNPLALSLRWELLIAIQAAETIAEAIDTISLVLI